MADGPKNRRHGEITGFGPGRSQYQVALDYDRHEPATARLMSWWIDRA